MHHADTPLSELAREKMWSRIHLIPLLQAEEDRDHVRRHLADQAREKELLGENVKVYHSDRCVFPSSLFLSPVDVVGDPMLTGGGRYVRPTFGVTPGVVSKE